MLISFNFFIYYFKWRERFIGFIFLFLFCMSVNTILGQLFQKVTFSTLISFKLWTVDIFKISFFSVLKNLSGFGENFSNRR